ncbi:MAG: hypothetical protein NVS1B14_06810 [Vulcanimicrobiaceae bacterium]
MRPSLPIIAFAILIVLGSRCPAQGASAFPKIEPTLALIGATHDDGELVTEGTAFCISSDGTRSYFLTANHVLTDENDAPAKHLVMILARDTNDVRPHRYPVTIVRQSADPDLALVSIEVPNIQHVRLSPTLPAIGDDIAIAGFPYTESVMWGAVFGGRGPMLDHRFPRELTPSMHRGAVSALHGGSYYIQYDALTDTGNSGGPLFDPSTGDVFGVVQASIEGSRQYRDLPSAVHNNLAISTTEGWEFIARAPVTVDRTVASGGEHLISHQLPRPCRLANNAFELAYGRWAQAHGRVLDIASAGDQPRYASHRVARARAWPRSQEAENAWQRTMENALSRFKTPSDARRTLVDRIRSETLSDSAIARALRQPVSRHAARTASGSIGDAARAAFARPRC